MEKNIVEYIKKHKVLKNVVVFIEFYSSKCVMAIFYIMLAFLLFSLDKRVIPCAIIPWLVFFAVTFVGQKLNCKRPFEDMGFEPVVPHVGGHAFPSRHAASSAIITMSAFYVDFRLGIITAVLSLLVCVSRVVTGIHYIRDVVCGVAISIVVGYICYFIIL